ncbi:hypothetical protein M3Y94_01282500 [Aphelenchoides besseyi]|nr:hypothetical protein M3Y94_01282500 [Aphelenchoides besseyi]
MSKDFGKCGSRFSHGWPLRTFSFIWSRFLVSIVKLRHHPWVGYLSFPFIVMIFLGPTTIGALTSASIALTFAMAQKSITAWYCMFIGCGQTLMVLLTSFLRILGTL